MLQDTAAPHPNTSAATLERRRHRSYTAGEPDDELVAVVVDLEDLRAHPEEAARDADSDAQSSPARTRAGAAPTKKGRGGREGKQGATKILFLDGVRGMAALLVVTEHSNYWAGKNLGACAVDTFFVLSSFLLTWLFYKKAERLLAQRASWRKWGYALADYFSKRFFRVYPLFALVAVFLWLLPYESQRRYFNVTEPNHFDLFQVLTFNFAHRYHVFWTLPLEIAYYFLIPVFVLATLWCGSAWWVPFVPIAVWIVDAGLKGFRVHHQPLEPHLPTFVVGSMGAVVYAKLHAAIKRKRFEFDWRVIVVVRTLEALVVALMLSVTFKGLLFHWVAKNPAPSTSGSQCISVHVTILIVVEMLLPSSLATLFEWNVLRFWGKISFSVYLLHSFVIYSPWLVDQSDTYDKFFARFFFTAVLSTASFYVVEYPCQLLSARISKALSPRGAAAPPHKYAPLAPATLDLRTEVRTLDVDDTGSTGGSSTAAGDTSALLHV